MTKDEFRAELAEAYTAKEEWRASCIALRQRYDAIYAEREQLREQLAKAVRCHAEDHEGVIRLLRLRLEEQRDAMRDMPVCTCLGLNNRAAVTHG